MGAGTLNDTGSALRFLFDITLDRPDIVRHLPVAREPRKAATHEEKDRSYSITSSARPSSDGGNTKC
jgi:hypothetical protein